MIWLVFAYLVIGLLIFRRPIYGLETCRDRWERRAWSVLWLPVTILCCWVKWREDAN